MSKTNERPKRLLLTAFEPFGSDDANSSELVLRSIQLKCSDDGSPVDTLLLPVERRAAVSELLSAVEKSRYDFVVCLGQAADRSEVTVERIGINYCSFDIPDNCGDKPIDETVVEAGPAAYFSTLPVRNLVDALKEAGVPASISNTAGTFVCNAVFYSALHEVSKRGLSIQVGFVHLPRVPEQLESRDEACLELELQVVAVEKTISVLLKGHDSFY